MKLSEFRFDLPQSLIALNPTENREDARGYDQDHRRCCRDVPGSAKPNRCFYVRECIHELGQITMKMTIKMPRVGDTVDSVYLVTWHKQPGDTVAVGDSLMEVETDKANVEVPSPVAGTIVELLFKDGDEIKTGDPIATCES